MPINLSTIYAKIGIGTSQELADGSDVTGKTWSAQVLRNAIDAVEGSVSSVNTQTGDVVLTTDDITEGTAKYTSAADISKLAGIESGAEVNDVNSVNGETGNVVLNTDDVDEGTTNKYFDSVSSTKLDGIESGAEVNTVDSVNGSTGVVVLDPDDLDDTSTTNKFTTQTEIDKLSGIEAGAQVNTVDSINSQTGTVVLDADDIDDTSTTNKFTTQTEIDKLAGIESGAEVNNISDANAAILTGGEASNADALHTHTIVSASIIADGASVSVNDMVYVYDVSGTITAALADNTGTAADGIVLSKDGDEVTIIKFGVISYANSFTTNAVLYLDTSGAVDESPSNGIQNQIVGRAISTTQILIDVQYPIISEVAQYVG